MESRTRRTIIAACGAGALLIGIVSIVVPLVADAGKTATSTDSVEVRSTASVAPAAPADAEAAVEVIGMVNTPLSGNGPANIWRVPVDAPFSSMPAGDECGPDQIAWLVEHAEPAAPTGRSLHVQVRNTADESGAMSIDRIRADGELIDGTQVVTLQCAGIGEGGSQFIALPLDGSPAVWGPPTGWEENPQPEGAPATLNLAPGELAEILFLLGDATRRFEGRIVADVVAPGSGSVVLAEGLSIESTPVPGYYLSFANGPLECTRPNGAATPCSFAEAEQFLQEASR